MNHDPVILPLDFESAREADKLVAITALTSFDQEDVRELGSECMVEELVNGRVRPVMGVGVAGVMESPLEAVR